MTYTPHHPPPPDPARSFTPVPVKPRHDGWTPERQAGFVEALAACNCVIDAAARVGMSSHSAYALRQREGSTSFRAAWDAALDHAVRRLSEGAFSRALHGVAVPHYYKGELVGEHRRFNESLTRFLLQHLDRARYAPVAGVTMFNRDEAKVVALADAVREILADPADEDAAPDVPDTAPDIALDVAPDMAPEAGGAHRHWTPAVDAPAFRMPPAALPMQNGVSDAAHRAWLRNCAEMERVRDMPDDGAWSTPIPVLRRDGGSTVLPGDVSRPSRSLDDWGGAAAMPDTAREHRPPAPCHILRHPPPV